MVQKNILSVFTGDGTLKVRALSSDLYRPCIKAQSSVNVDIPVSSMVTECKQTEARSFPTSPMVPECKQTEAKSFPTSPMVTECEQTEARISSQNNQESNNLSQQFKNLKDLPDTRSSPENSNRGKYFRARHSSSSSSRNSSRSSEFEDRSISRSSSQNSNVGKTVEKVPRSRRPNSRSASRNSNGEYQCDECSYASAHSSSLQRHMDSTHLGRRYQESDFNHQTLFLFYFLNKNNLNDFDTFS